MKKFFRQPIWSFYRCGIWLNRGCPPKLGAETNKIRREAMVEWFVESTGGVERREGRQAANVVLWH